MGIPDSVMQQVQEILERDRQRNGSCLRKNETMTLFLKGDPWKCMPIFNEGCEDYCYFISNSSEAKGIFYHSTTTSVPVRAYPEQKVIGLGLEPRTDGGGHVWGELVRNGSDALITYNMDCNLPQSYYHFADPVGEITKLGVPTLEDFNQRKLILFVSSNCKPERVRYVAELMKLVPIDSRGKCLNNGRLLPGDHNTNPAVFKDYKFVIGMDKVYDQDYVSEKFFFPFFGHSIPVYAGPKTAEILAPGNHSYIDAYSFENLTALADHLLEVGNDYNKWVEYFDFQRRPIEDWRAQIMNWANLNPSSLCRVCDCFCDEDCVSKPNPGNGIDWSAFYRKIDRPEGDRNQPESDNQTQSEGANFTQVDDNLTASDEIIRREDRIQGNNTEEMKINDKGTTTPPPTTTTTIDEDKAAVAEKTIIKENNHVQRDSEETTHNRTAET